MSDLFGKLFGPSPEVEIVITQMEHQPGDLPDRKQINFQIEGLNGQSVSPQQVLTLLGAVAQAVQAQAQQEAPK